MTSYVGTTRADSISGGSDADIIKSRSGHDTLAGGAGADNLFSGEGSDRLDGGAGDDTLTGGADGDRLHGGLGHDVVSDFDAAEDIILIGGAAGSLMGINQDGADAVLLFDSGATLRVLNTTAGAFNETTLADWLQGGDAAETLRGSSGRDLITGGLGGDVLDGGGGADTLEGGAGNDTYYVDGQFGVTYGGGGEPVVVGPNAPADLLVEMAQEGVDTVVSRATLTLGANLENLVLGVASSGTPEVTGPRIDGRGNGLDNVVTGSSAGNGLWGEAGKDTLSGAGGSDTLFGGSGRDVLTGGDGSDVLWGGGGKDVLTGGSGADMFRFALFNEGGDRITDFDATDGDVIDVSALDAKAGREGDQAFRFVEAFSGRNGQAVLTYDARTDQSVLMLDQDGDTVADFTLFIAGEVGTDAGWVL